MFEKAAMLMLARIVEYRCIHRRCDCPHLSLVWLNDVYKPLIMITIFIESRTYLDIAISWTSYEEFLVGIHCNAFNTIVVCLLQGDKKKVESVLIQLKCQNVIQSTWKRSLKDLWRISNMQTSPFFPADTISWCCGAYVRHEAPWSWQAKAVSKKSTP